MASHLQLMARGIAVAARRLEREGIDPLECEPTEALAMLQYHPGPIGTWATGCNYAEFDCWISMWNGYRWMRGWYQRRETDATG